MKTYNCDHIRINTVPNKTYNGNKATNNASCCTVGTTLYGIKAQDDGIVVLYKIPNYTQPNSPVTFYPIKYNDGKFFKCHHANSITTCRGGFIIATIDKPAAVKISKTGKIIKEIRRISTTGEERTMTTISFARVLNGHNQYIICDTIGYGDGTFTPRYRLATLNGNLYETEVTFTSDLRLPNKFISNDTTYDPKTKQFYITYFTMNSEGKVTTSYVYQFKIPSLNSSQNIVAAKQWIAKRKGKETAFEIETFFFGGPKNTTKYCMNNIQGEGKKDGLFKLTNKS